MFKNNKHEGDYYSLRVPGEQKTYIFSELAGKVGNYPPPHEVNESRRKKLLVKSAFSNLISRVAYSALIFGIVFFMLNWQSYNQVFKAKVDEWRGKTQTSVLQDLIDVELTDTENPVTDTIIQVQVENPVKKFGISKFSKSATESKSVNLPKLLKVNKNPELEKTNVPSLEMEVRPPDTRLVIPRINRNVPIVQVRADNLMKRDWNALEDDMMEALKYGIVHFPGTAMPGEHGNIAMTGHSSYFPWDPGRFKDVFALLHEVKMGDNILLYHKQQKYIYEVTDIKIVQPDEIDVLKPTGDDRLTLITCTPIGTDLRRLIVTAKFIKEG